MAGLEKLEYRGYDSAGISVISDGQIDSVRAVGNLANLRSALEEHSQNGDSGSVAVVAKPATIGLGHTRWATHGRVTEENAHPHGDCGDAIQIEGLRWEVLRSWRDLDDVLLAFCVYHPKEEQTRPRPASK